MLFAYHKPVCDIGVISAPTERYHESAINPMEIPIFLWFFYDFSIRLCPTLVLEPSQVDQHGDSTRLCLVSGEIIAITSAVETSAVALRTGRLASVHHYGSGKICPSLPVIYIYIYIHMCIYIHT